MKKYILMFAVLGLAFSCTKKEENTESDVMIEEPVATVSDSATVPMPERATQDTTGAGATADSATTAAP